MVNVSDNEPNDSPAEKIDAKLKAVAEAAAPKPPWYEAWSQLGPHSSMEERLAVYQAIHRSGNLPDAASFWLVAKLIDDIAAEDADDELGEYEERMGDIEAAYRFDEGEVWSPGSSPEGYRELREEYGRAWDDLFARRLVEFGEPEMAQLFREDREQFERLAEEGRQYFFGPGTPDESVPDLWLREFAETVAANMTADSAMGPLGYRYREEEGFWEIDIYPTPVELIGGAVDGEVVSPGFAVDLEGLRAMFERVEAFSWQSLGLAPGEGPYVAIKGSYQGREVYIQLFAYAPEDEEPGMKLDTIRRRR